MSQAVLPVVFCEAPVGSAYFARLGSPVALGVATNSSEKRRSSRVPPHAGESAQLWQSGLESTPPGHGTKALSSLPCNTLQPASAFRSSAFALAASTLLRRIAARACSELASLTHCVACVAASSPA